MCEREMNICLSILPLYVPSTRGVRVRLESRVNIQLQKDWGMREA